MGPEKQLFGTENREARLSQQANGFRGGGGGGGGGAAQGANLTFYFKILVRPPLLKNPGSVPEGGRGGRAIGRLLKSDGGSIL